MKWLSHFPAAKQYICNNRFVKKYLADSLQWTVDVNELEEIAD